MMIVPFCWGSPEDDIDYEELYCEELWDLLDTHLWHCGHYGGCDGVDLDILEEILQAMKKKGCLDWEKVKKLMLENGVK